MELEPILAEAAEKFMGISIDELNKDLADVLNEPLIDFEINTSKKFKQAKNEFKRKFFTKLIETHFGNISEVAKIADLDRRSVHRIISKLGIDIKKCRSELLNKNYYKKMAFDNIIKHTINQYKKKLQPNSLSEMYQGLSQFSEDVLRKIPTCEPTYKEAEEKFEKRYITQALKENKKSITKTARKIGLRYETLQRKIKSLKI